MHRLGTVSKNSYTRGLKLVLWQVLRQRLSFGGKQYTKELK